MTRLAYSDILHPNRANIAKDELREKLGALYKAQKDQISVFGLRTQFGGGKTTGFALIYDSPEAMKKFEPQYRLVRVGLATKTERASRQQRAYPSMTVASFGNTCCVDVGLDEDGRTVAETQTANVVSSTLQASSARTDKRLSAERRRSRVPRRRRRNKRRNPCISSDWWGSCGVLPSAATGMRVRPFLRHEGRVDGILDSVRRREGLAFMIFPQYTSMKSMVFRVSDQKYYMTHISSLRLLFRLVACGCARLSLSMNWKGRGRHYQWICHNRRNHFNG